MNVVVRFISEAVVGEKSASDLFASLKRAVGDELNLDHRNRG